MRGDIIAGVGFLAVVLLGLWVARRPARPADDSLPSRGVHALIGVSLALTALTGATQRELWPFSDWKLMAHVTPSNVSTLALVCVEATGGTFAVDHRAWSPLTEEELIAWMGGPFLRLDETQKDSTRAYLRARAELARQRARNGRHPSARPSPLGPFAAPSHLLHPTRWTRPELTPATPCAALRLVLRRWNVLDVASGRDSIHHESLWQYPAAP